MSKMSRIVEYGWQKKHPKYFDSAEAARKHLQERSLVEDEPYKLPKLIYRTKAESRDMFGCQMLTFNDTDTAERTVIYLHGGIYVNEIVIPHVTFCDKLAKKANACVYAPVYPLAPNHTYEETYEITEKLYRHLLETGKPITVMGDSAGGGLALAFCQYLAQIGLDQPDDLILISPWMDITMSGEYSEVEFDPIGGIEALRVMGSAWAGNLDLKDYKVSPMFGEVSGLSRITIFVGTHETLYADIIKFHERLIENGIEVELNVGEGMNHVYPVYPLVPESKEAFNHIVEVIMKQKTQDF